MSEQEIDDLRDDIEQTREDMSQTIDQLQARLAPGRLQDDTTDLVRQIAEQVIAEVTSATGGLSQMIGDQIQTAVHGAATAKAEALFDQSMTRVRDTSSTLWGRMADHPAPAALAAVGIGLLAAGARDGNTSEGATGQVGTGSSLIDGVDRWLGDANRALDSIGVSASGAGERVTGMMEGAKEKMRSASPMADGGSMTDMFGGQSLMAGLLALGLGLAVGLGVPESEQERRMAAPIRERAESMLGEAGMSGNPREMMDQAKQQIGNVVEQAKSMAGDGLGQAKSMATDMAGTVRESAMGASSE